MAAKQPLIVAYGGGRDSTALLIEMHRRGIKPGAILMANVGSEKIGTYRFLPIFNRWLVAHGFPGITMVAYTPRKAPYRSMEGNCVLNGTLPGATFGRGSCTDKYKICPQRKWTERWQPALEAWVTGQKVIRYIGFECDETHRLKRADAKMHAGKGNPKDAERYEVQYPLMDWGINLEKCIEIIREAKLPVPPKSACFMCPNSKPPEIHDLTDDDRARIMLCEISAEPYNRAMRGLWRKPRKKDNRPGSITEYILQEKLSFTPLTAFGKKIVLNPNCAKFENGFTLKPPHVGPTLRDQLAAAGYAVPEIIRDAEGEIDIYHEDYRTIESVCGEGCMDCDDIDVETDQHLELVEAL